MSDTPVVIELSRDALLILTGFFSDNSWAQKYRLSAVVMPQLRRGDSITITHSERRRLDDVLTSYLRGGLANDFHFTKADLDAVLDHFAGFSKAVVVRTSQSRHVSDHTVAVRVTFRFAEGEEHYAEVPFGDPNDYPAGLKVLAGTSGPHRAFTIRPA